MHDDLSSQPDGSETNRESGSVGLDQLSAVDFQEAKLALQSEFSGLAGRWGVRFWDAHPDSSGAIAGPSDFHTALRWMERSLSQQERTARLVRRVGYPLLMTCLVLGVFFLLNVTIIRDFDQIYSEFGLELPAVTRWMMALSRSSLQNPVWFFGTWALIACAATAFISIISRFRHRIPILRYFSNGSYESLDRAIYLCDSAVVAFSEGRERSEIIRKLTQAKAHPSFEEGLHKLSQNLEGDWESIHEAGRPLPANFAAAFYKGHDRTQAIAMLEAISINLRQRIQHRNATLGSQPIQLAVVLTGAVFALVFIALLSPCFYLISALAG